MRERRLTGIRAGSIGFIFQTFNLIPTLSAAENVEAALVPLGVGHARRRARARAALTAVGLGERLHHLPSSCPVASSSGWQSRVRSSRSRGCCWPTSPPAISTRALATRSSDLLKALWRRHGLTMVVVTHDSTVAARAQRLGLMRSGRLTVTQAANQPPA